IATTSPGQSVGSMLAPCTRKDKRPALRNASTAKAARCALTLSQALIEFWRSGTLTRKLTRRRGRADLAACQRQRLKNFLLAKCRFLVGLLALSRVFNLFALVARHLIFLRHRFVQPGTGSLQALIEDYVLEVYYTDSCLPIKIACERIPKGQVTISRK